MANEQMSLSSAGYAQLRINEGVVMHYYNDAPLRGNCTWGVGTLAHYGPCTPEELKRSVLPQQVDAVLIERVREAERIIRSFGRHTPLTQTQFDALVSFAYNSRTRNIRIVMLAVDSGDMNGAANAMMKNVYVVPRDSQGHKIGSGQLNPGLVNRRRRESAPFRGHP